MVDGGRRGGDVRHFGLDSVAPGELYAPYLQEPWPGDLRTPAARAVLFLVTGRAASWVPARPLASLDPAESLRAD